MAEQKEEIKEILIANAKVLSAKDGGTFQGTQGPVQMWDLVVQDVDNPTQVYTGTTFRKELPEGVTIEHGGDVKEVKVEIKKKDDKVRTKFTFSDQGKKDGYSSGGKRYGKSEEELKIMRFEAMGKIVGVGYSYAFMDSPDLSVEDKCKNGNFIAEEMLKENKNLLGG